MILWGNKVFFLNIILRYKLCFRCDIKYFIEKIIEYFLLINLVIVEYEVI